MAVAGGFESMSNIPHYLPSLRGGLRLGHGQVVDGMLKDGLWDPHNDMHMGSCAELCAERFGISRQQQVRLLDSTRQFTSPTTRSCDHHI